MEASTDDTPEPTEVAAPLPLLASPADGIPDVVADERSLARSAEQLGSGTGPLAIDAERASGYRYGQRAYLVQLRREGAGTHLIDPVACPDLSPLGTALDGVEWVLHAATQDLPCLAQLNLRPRELFDTELAARLAGLPRVGLAAVVEHYLGVSLAKEHSAVDWSTRPLPEPWLRYAALDVEVLIEVRNLIEADLSEQGKLTWAQEEFAALTGFTGPPARVDPWRRTSGMHKVRNRRTSAIVRELWQARDTIAQDRDISPGRVLPDALLLQLALTAPRTTAALSEVSSNRAVRRHGTAWVQAINRALDLADDALPTPTLPNDGPPPVRAWADRDPVAAARLAAVRESLTAFAEEHRIPIENVMSPDSLRRVIWAPRTESAEGVSAALMSLGAREWQVRIATPMIITAFQEHS